MGKAEKKQRKRSPGNPIQLRWGVMQLKFAGRLEKKLNGSLDDVCVSIEDERKQKKKRRNRCAKVKRGERLMPDMKSVAYMK